MRTEDVFHQSATNRRLERLTDSRQSPRQDLKSSEGAPFSIQAANLHYDSVVAGGWISEIFRGPPPRSRMQMEAMAIICKRKPPDLFRSPNN